MVGTLCSGAVSAHYSAAVEIGIACGHIGTAKAGETPLPLDALRLWARSWVGRPRIEN